MTIVSIEDIDYVSLIANSDLFQQEAESLVALFALGVGRIIPIVAIVPFLGAKVLNKPAKIMMALLFTAIVYPKILTSSPHPMRFDLFFAMSLLKELLIGFVFAILATLPFYVAESAGVIVDHQRGASSLMVNDPILQSQNSPLGILFTNFSIVMFYYNEGIYLFIDTVIDSFNLLPVHTLLSPHFFDKNSVYAETIYGYLNKEMMLAIKIGSPALLIIFMTDLFLGISNRLAPQVQITFLGLPLKAFCGLLVIWLGLRVILKQLDIELDEWLVGFKNMTHWIRYGIP